MEKAEKIAAIVAITHIFKYYGMPSKFCPVIAILLGAVLQYTDNPTANGIIEGVVLGSVATGGYGVVKGSAQTVLKTPQQTAVDFSDADDDRCG